MMVKMVSMSILSMGCFPFDRWFCHFLSWEIAFFCQI
jgi:hypothetical protein